MEFTAMDLFSLLGKNEKAELKKQIKKEFEKAISNLHIEFEPIKSDFTKIKKEFEKAISNLHIEFEPIKLDFTNKIGDVIKEVLESEIIWDEIEWELIGKEITKLLVKELKKINSK